MLITKPEKWGFGALEAGEQWRDGQDVPGVAQETMLVATMEMVSWVEVVDCAKDRGMMMTKQVFASFSVLRSPCFCCFVSVSVGWIRIECIHIQ